VTLSFGFVDIALMRSHLFLYPQSLLFNPRQEIWHFFRKIFARFFTSPIGKSYLLTLASQRFIAGGRELNLKNWTATMTRMLDELERRNIPVVLMNPIAGGFSDAEFAALTNARKRVFFFNTKAYLKEHSAKADLPENNWTKEFDPLTRALILKDPMHKYKVNFSHPNAAAMSKIAEGLAALPIWNQK
jgi:hypothetical protein